MWIKFVAQNINWNSTFNNCKNYRSFTEPLRSPYYKKKYWFSWSSLNDLPYSVGVYTPDVSLVWTSVYLLLCDVLTAQMICFLPPISLEPTRPVVLEFRRQCFHLRRAPSIRYWQHCLENLQYEPHIVGLEICTNTFRMVPQFPKKWYGIDFELCNIWFFLKFLGFKHSTVTSFGIQCARRIYFWNIYKTWIFGFHWKTITLAQMFIKICFV